MNISEVIIEEVNSEDCTVQDINSGKCGDFAVGLSKGFDANYVNNFKFAAHVGGEHIWIEHNGVHYDAEMPEGTMD